MLSLHSLTLTSDWSVPVCVCGEGTSVKLCKFFSFLITKNDGPEKKSLLLSSTPHSSSRLHSWVRKKIQEEFFSRAGGGVHSFQFIINRSGERKMGTETSLKDIYIIEKLKPIWPTMALRWTEYHDVTIFWTFLLKKKRFDYGKRLLSDFIPFFPAYSISGMRDSPGKVGPVD